MMIKHIDKMLISNIRLQIINIKYFQRCLGKFEISFLNFFSSACPVKCGANFMGLVQVRKVMMEKALFHEDSNQPPLSSPPCQGGERGVVISSRYNIRYSAKISG